MFIGHLSVFSGEISVEVFCPIFDWVIMFLNNSCDKFKEFFISHPRQNKTQGAPNLELMWKKKIIEDFSGIIKEN